MNKILTIPIFAFTPMLAHAADILPVKQIGLELATEIAMKSIEACRKDGYNVSAVVLNRAGRVQAALKAVEERLEFAD